jgi:hypothetical protein
VAGLYALFHFQEREEPARGFRQLGSGLVDAFGAELIGAWPRVEGGGPGV